ncbi:transposase [Bacillus amyloliquefaciens]|nr:transposase [Bacillus amyloliquefaciens]
MFPKWKFHYDSEQDRSICLNHQTLTYAATDRKGYRSYKSNPEICSECPFLEQWTRSKNHQKVITRHVWEDDKEKVRQNRLSVSGKNLCKKKKK